MEKNSERRRFVKQYQESVFGEWQNQEVRAYRLENDKGYQLSVMTYGATILEYVTPDKEDQFANIILGVWKLITVPTATTVDRRVGTAPCLAWSR